MPKTDPTVGNTQVQQKSKILENYTLGETLGRGAFGKVKLGIHKPTSEKVAIKILEKAKLVDADDIKRVNREIDLLKCCRHEHVIRVYEVLETESEFYIVMEYVSGGELSDYIIAKKFLKEEEACRLFQQITDAIDYLGKSGIAHRDLKPENILLDENRNVKIIDFGLSNTYALGELLKTACGSPCYAAPEMIAGKSYFGHGADIWSSGIILYTMLSGHLPFEDRNANNLYKKILEDDFVIPRHISSSAKDVLRNILIKDPSKRFKTSDILQHPWFNRLLDTQVLGEDLKDNTSINQDVLQHLSNYGLDITEAQKSINEDKHDHLTAAYYLLQKKCLRNEESLDKNKNTKVPISSQETSQSDGGSSPNSNHTKVSLNILQVNRVGNSLTTTTEKKRSDPIQSIKIQSKALSDTKEAKEIPQFTDKISSLVSARQQVSKSKEKLISSRKGSTDHSHGWKDINDILKSHNKKLRIKTSFLTQLKEARGNLNPSTSRQDISLNRDEVIRPKTERERIDLNSSLLVAKELDLNYKPHLEVKSPISKPLKLENFVVDTKAEILSTNYCNTEEKEPGVENSSNCENWIENFDKIENLEKSVGTASSKSISNDSNQDQDSTPNGFSKARAQGSYLKNISKLPNGNNNDLYVSIRNTLKSNTMTLVQGLSSPKNHKLEFNNSSLMNSKVNSSELKSSAEPRQNGASLDAIKKLIKNSFGPKQSLREEHLHSGVPDKNPIYGNTDFTKAFNHIDIQESSEQTPLYVKQLNQTPKAQHGVSFLHSRDSPHRNYSRDLISELGDSNCGINVKKATNQTNVDILLLKDIKRRKSTQKGGGILEIGGQTKFKSSLWPAAPVPCEEEQNRLYNKFKKHLINIQ